MSAMENMVRTILKSMDIDVEAMKAEVTSRIVAFEENVKTLNSTLITLLKRTEAIENKLDALCEFHNIPTATTETTNEPRKLTDRKSA
jgi:NAD(P)H-dependent flavin oxidoreductase YrpB (nitropropane dioxygenase family)